MEKPTCRWPECDAPSFCRGYCVRDYRRAASVGDYDEPWVKWNPPRPCARCGREFVGRRPIKVYCSQACSVAAYAEANPDKRRRYTRDSAERHAGIRRLRQAERRDRIRVSRVEDFTTEDVRARHGDVCYLCATVVDFDLKYPDPMSPSLDHIVPLSTGGGHVLENVAFVHLTCNIRKGARPI